jgi:hypothetical protein
MAFMETINKLYNIKEQILNELEYHDVNIPLETTFSNIPELIEQISGFLNYTHRSIIERTIISYHN